MGAPSRIDRLVKALGGEQNLPPKPPSPIIVTIEHEPATPEDNPTGQDIKPLEEFVEEQQTTGEDWWNAKPFCPPQASGSASPTQSQAAEPPKMFTSNGEMHYSLDPCKDDPAPRGIKFCPLLGVARYPYKFVKKEYMQEIASKFFDAQKIWQRPWEVYYIHSSHFESAKPITFVPEYQLLALLDEINAAIPKAKVRITDDNREEGLVIDFDDIDLPELRPKFLGNSVSRDQIDNWTSHLPPTTTMFVPSERTLGAFKAKMELAAEVAKNKSKAAKKQRQADNFVKRQDMVRMVLRTQRYLGIASNPDKNNNISDVSSLHVNTLNVNNKVPHLFDQDVIFISVDVEAWEEPPRPITEVGIATLDTRDLHALPPGPNGTNWQQGIRARHYLIEEEKHHVNRRYVAGCPDKFEFNNHHSDSIHRSDIRDAVTRCFNPPYSHPAPTPSDLHEPRHLVLVGQAVEGDVTYLKQLGVHLSTFTGILDTVDTAALFKAHTHDPNARSLGHILNEFDLMGWHLHNAGNDAVYTLWAMLAICLKEGEEAGTAEAEARREQRLRERMEVAVEVARERVVDEDAGWESTGSDGGVPVRPGGGLGGGGTLYTAGGKVLDV